MTEANGLLMHEIQTALLLITFVPMIAAAVFVILTFSRMGYGVIGKWLSGGYFVLVVSLIFGTINTLMGPNQEVQLIASVTRVMGWTGIAIGFVYLYIETDRNIP